MQKKKVWIMNHYATNMFFNKGGRHYWFSENLLKRGYEPTIFCANTRHNINEEIDLKERITKVEKVNEIPFVFVKTLSYKNNGVNRVRNMVSFYRNLFPATKEYLEIDGKPDIILASSVHPLTLIAGLKIAQKLGVPCICEVRDLWPESLSAYGSLKKNGLLAKILYLGEKWIYKKADKLIFTMEGGKDYIIEKGWDKEKKNPINLNKVHHINNGVDLEKFNWNKRNSRIEDEDLENKDTFKIIYTGSIRKVNNVGKIVEVAKMLQEKKQMGFMFLIYGDGPERQELEKYCIDHNLSNIKFKGRVDKNIIPFILSVSDLNFIHFEQNNIKKYGVSMNKMFEYFASGKPIISDCEFGYDLIKKYNAGVVIDHASPEELSESIIGFFNMKKSEYDLYSSNSLKAAKNYSFENLTTDLIEVIEN